MNCYALTQGADLDTTEHDALLHSQADVQE